MFLLVIEGSLEEIQPHQGGLATLPGKGDFGRLLRVDVLAGKCIQQFISHAEAAAGIHHLFGKEVTIFAIQIANRAAWLGHNMECVNRRCRRLGSFHGTKFSPTGARRKRE